MAFEKYKPRGLFSEFYGIHNSKSRPRSQFLALLLQRERELKTTECYVHRIYITLVCRTSWQNYRLIARGEDELNP